MKHFVRLLAVPATLVAVAGCSTSHQSTSTSTTAGATTPSTPAALGTDFEQLCGAPWTGTLTYLDYKSAKPVTLRCTLDVSHAGDAANPAWNVAFGYPDEPKANHKDIIHILDSGRRIDDETVTARSVRSDGTVELITERDGEDNDKPARFRYVYLLSNKTCSIQKLVITPQGATFERNIYRFKR